MSVSARPSSSENESGEEDADKRGTADDDEVLDSERRDVLRSRGLRSGVG